MTPIIEYGFEGQMVRIVERDGAPWFVLADVCRVLDIKQPTRAAERLDDDEKDVSLTHTLGGDQSMIVVNESGLYTIILRSDAAVRSGTPAHRFRKWVTAELLPAVRRDGYYGRARLSVDAMVRLQRERRRIARELIRETHPVERDSLYADLVRTNARLGAETPPMELLGQSVLSIADRTAPFFDVLAALDAGGVVWNHSRKPDQVWAVSMPQLTRLAEAQGIAFQLTEDLGRALRADPRFVAAKTVNSVSGKVVHCWVFDAVRTHVIHREDGSPAQRR